MLTLIDALAGQRPCFGNCHFTLGLEQRRRAIALLYQLDDALRGWGYSPIYDLHGDLLWKEAQSKGDPAYRGVAVRFGECIYRRLVGSLLHEALHASFGDVAQANYGIPFGLPYGVPAEVPEKDEEAYLAPFNFAEARAFVGVGVLSSHLGIDWEALNSREFGTFCFRGGNALVRVPAGFRAVAHIDPVHNPERYLARARRLESEARAWFTTARIGELMERVNAAASTGRAARSTRYPAPDTFAKMGPGKIGRNDPCPCTSGKKVKDCCGDRARSDTAGAQAYLR